MVVGGVVIALASVALAALALTGTLSLLLYKAQRETMRVRDVLESERKVTAEYKSQRDVTSAALAVAEQRIKDEIDLRSAAEAQRNEAQRRVRELLSARMKEASPDDIEALVKETFGRPLSESPGTELLDPFKL